MLLKKSLLLVTALVIASTVAELHARARLRFSVGSGPAYSTSYSSYTTNAVHWRHGPAHYRHRWPHPRLHRGYRPAYRVCYSRPVRPVTYVVTGSWCPPAVPRRIPSVRFVRLHEPDPVVITTGSSSVKLSREQQFIDTLMIGPADERLQAAEALAAHPDIASAAALVDALVNDADARVRAAAADSLGMIAEPLTYEALIRTERAETADPVLQAVRRAADEIARKADIESLLLTDPMPQMNYGEAKLAEYLEDLRYGSSSERKHAAEKLDDYKGTQPVAALINAMINDRDDDVREEAAESLGKIGDRMALGFLKVAQRNDRDKSVRKDAKKAIERIYDTIQ